VSIAVSWVSTHWKPHSVGRSRRHSTNRLGIGLDRGAFWGRVEIVIGAGAPADRFSPANQRDPIISRVLDVQSALD